MKAWATLLTTPSYVIGVRALRASLERSGSDHPLVVMVNDGIDEEIRHLLEADGCLVRPVESIVPRQDAGTNYANARFAEVWTKLAVWSLTEFEVVTFLDADMLVIQNMDELMATAPPPGWIAAAHACLCNPNKIASYPADWTPDRCFYTPRPVGDLATPPTQYFNAGLLVLRPDLSVFAELLTKLADIEDLSRFQFAEQDFLNDFYRDHWQPLPYVYNALKTLQFQHPDLWHPDEVKNIHYIIDKPWDSSLDPGDRYYPVEKLWWDVAATLSQPQEAAARG